MHRHRAWRWYKRSFIQHFRKQNCLFSSWIWILFCNHWKRLYLFCMQKNGSYMSRLFFYKYVVWRIFLYLNAFKFDQTKSFLILYMITFDFAEHYYKREGFFLLICSVLELLIIFNLKAKRFLRYTKNIPWHVV